MSGRSTMNVNQEPGPSTSRSSRAESGSQYIEDDFYVDPTQISEFDDDAAFDLSLFKPAGTRNSRDYYPLRHHQLMFDAWEAAHPYGPAPGTGGNLADLQDGDPNRKGGRPPHGLRFIIECAIYGSPQKRLTLREIKIAMNSVRHALSRLPNFQQLKRSAKDSDPGDWWIRTQSAAPNITPSARSERIPVTSPRHSSNKPGRKPKAQLWSGMTSVLPLSTSSTTQSVSASAPTSDDDDDPPDPPDPPSPPDADNQHTDVPSQTGPLPPFVHPERPNRSLPGLRSTGLLGGNV